MQSKFVACLGGGGSSANTEFGSMEISPIRRQELWRTTWINDLSMDINIFSNDIWIVSTFWDQFNLSIHSAGRFSDRELTIQIRNEHRPNGCHKEITFKKEKEKKETSPGKRIHSTATLSYRGHCNMEFTKTIFTIIWQGTLKVFKSRAQSMDKQVIIIG